VLVEASRYDEFRIGETLPPPVRPILEHLHVWEAFLAQHHCEVHGTTAIWGSTIPLDNDFIFMPANTGWHIDRTAFDSMLVTQAAERGVTVIAGARLRDFERAGKEWRLKLSKGKDINARFVVDASGGNALFGRRCGARFIESDQLVAIGRVFEGKSYDPRTLVEAFDDGWWYTAGLPDGKRIAACVTDSDLAREMKINDLEQWCSRLADMKSICAMLQESKPVGTLIIRSTRSRRLDPATGDGWLAVGDAASRFDPLSSQGILKALRSGIFASYVIGDLLERDDNSGMRRFRNYVKEEFKSYSEVRAKYYREEQRWPASEFWRRRHLTSRSATAGQFYSNPSERSVESVTS
jgi:flavin-dependent dehydrogenase